MRFMDAGTHSIDGIGCFVSRSGYTGEDGFEISVPAEHAERLVKLLLENSDVLPIGLGARDSLRLEAGLCLYGHEIDTTTTPIEAGLTWAIQKVRRPGGDRAGGYPGVSTIERQLAHGAERKRVGLVGIDRAPVREGAAIVDDAGIAIGRVTSGTIGPTVGKPVALAYVPAPLAVPGTKLDAEVRGKRQPMQVVSLPFAPHHYFRG
jgi:aminomethyltransferase